MMDEPSARLGVDVGGTFTDLVLHDPRRNLVHTGKLLSVVYDIADLYKTDLTVPLAFRLAASVSRELERAARIECRREQIAKAAPKSPVKRFVERRRSHAR